MTDFLCLIWNFICPNRNRYRNRYRKAGPWNASISICSPVQDVSASIWVTPGSQAPLVWFIRFRWDTV